MRVLVYHPAAHAELEAEVANCERERVGAGSRVRGDITAALQLLVDFPAIGRVGQDGTRRFVTNQYHYILHYELIADQVVIWAIADPAREPGYWSRRRAP